MKFFRIPPSDTHPCYRQQVSLSGTQYTLEIRFNTRMGRWLLSVLTLGEQPLLLGVPMLVNRNLAGQYTTLSLPPGAFVVLDNSGNDLQPGLSSFLTDHDLLYLDPTQ